VGGVRDPEVGRGAEPQLGIDAVLAARLEQRLGRRVEVALAELGDAGVVLVARVAVLAAQASPKATNEHDGQDHVPHAALRSPAPAPTHSAASSATSA